MYRYQRLFTYLNQNKLGAFVPFVTIGDPDTESFIKIIDTLIHSGADALELGIPFSDPIADGTAIQKSMKRALNSNINLSDCLQLISNIRKKYTEIPIGLLIYANLVFKHNINHFYAQCSKLKIDSVLIPDVPIEECLPFYQAAKYYKIAYIFICPPEASENLIKNIVNKNNGGYIYLLSRIGTTGINKIEFNTTSLNMLIQNIKKKQIMLPILQGFGIYTPDQARMSLLSGTNGVIIGSAISEIINDNLHDINRLLEKIRKFTHLIKISMKFS